MLISDLKKEFYDLLVGKRVLLLVHYDIDAICATKILQHLFRTDHIVYTVVPVQTKESLKESFIQHSQQIKYVILINCGGCIDLVEFLQPKEDICLFIADTHRPFDVCNIYNDGQVRIISTLDDDEEVPALEDVFREDDSDDEMNSDDEDRPRFDEAALEKRREKRLWDQKRQKLLFDYTQFAFFGSSTAMLIYDLAWKLSKDCNEVLWLAIVGVSHLLYAGRIEQEKYLVATATLQNHVSRLNHQQQDEKLLDTMRITFDKELYLLLYRHWSIVESMKHSPYIATTLRLWTLKGEKKLHEMFAEVGLPLSECKQKYTSMDVAMRNEVQTLLESKAEKYGLVQLLFASFVASRGFRCRNSALDFVLSTSAILECGDRERTPADLFLDSCDSLSVNHLMEKGIELSKVQLEAVYKQVTTFLNMNQVISAGPFLYACVLQGCPDTHIFSSPHSLLMLAQFTLKAHVSISRSKKARSLPLVITTPEVRSPIVSKGETLETCLVCGIPPLCEEFPKNFFGKAFEQAVEKTSSIAELDFFDSNIIRLNVGDRSKFFDALISLLI